MWYKPHGDSNVIFLPHDLCPGPLLLTRLTKLAPKLWRIYRWIITQLLIHVNFNIGMAKWPLKLGHRLAIEFHRKPLVALLSTLRPRQNGRHFPDDIFKWIFLHENVWISINISLKFVPRGPINNILTLVQVMAWRRPGDKPLSEPMMVRLPTHKCATRPQWVNHALTPGKRHTDV